MRVVLAGAGRFGTLHARVWTEAGASIVGVVDAVPERARTLAHSLGATVHGADLGDVLQRTPSDVVIIATDESTHSDLARIALSAGRSVFVEKPFALSGAAAEATVELAERLGLHAFAGQISRFADPYVYAREALESGRLGDLWALRFRRDFPRAWFADFGSRVHPLWESAIHDIDLAVQLAASPPSQAYAVESRAAGASAPSVLTAVVQFRSGVTATIESAWNLPERSPQTLSGALALDGTIAAECEVIGSEGTIKQRLISDAVTEWNANGVLVPDLSLWPERGGTIGGALRAEVDEAIAVIGGGKPNARMPHEQAVAGVRIAEAMQDSITSGLPVRIG